MLVKAVNIKKDFIVGDVTVHALKGVSFEIKAGLFYSFIGPSGSGKTSLLNLIGCLDKPTEGKIWVNGTDVSTLNRVKSALFRGSNIGFIFQDFNLIPTLTVYENIEYPLIMVQEVSSAERHDRIISILESVEMVDQRGKYPDQISGGQKQRTAIARALISQPKIILADEPTANLDHKTAFTVIDLMKKMNDELNTTFIFSTHDPKVVGEAETLFTLEDGKITGVKNRKRKRIKKQ